MTYLSAVHPQTLALPKRSVRFDRYFDRFFYFEHEVARVFHSPRDVRDVKPDGRMSPVRRRRGLYIHRHLMCGAVNRKCAENLQLGRTRDGKRSLQTFRDKHGLRIFRRLQYVRMHVVIA